MFTWHVRPLSQQVFKLISSSMKEVKLGYIVLHKHFDFSEIILYKTTLKPLTVVMLFLPSSSSLLPPSCSSSSSLPCVWRCFRTWQEAQIRGLKLDQIFSRYRFLRVPPLPPSCFQSLPPLVLPLKSLTFALLTAGTSKVVCCTQTYTHSHRQPRTYAHGES